jgi:GT2 family glycosyltransferase
MDVSIIIVNWNTKRLLLDCLASVYKTVKNISFEIWLIDNASSDGSVEAVKQNYPDVKIIQNKKNLGFAAGNNIALKRMRGQYALLLNTDTSIQTRSSRTERLKIFLILWKKILMQAWHAVNCLIRMDQNRTLLPIFRAYSHCFAMKAFCRYYFQKNSREREENIKGLSRWIHVSEPV